MNRNKLLLSIYGVTSGIIINLIGKLMLAEIIGLITLPLTNIRQLLRQYKGLRIVVLCLLLFLLAQIISDLINQSSYTDYIRGWALIVFSIISTIFLVNHLSKKSDSIAYYLLGLFFIRLIFGNSELDLSQWEGNTNIFKSRFVVFLNPIILFSSYYLFKLNKQHATAFLLLLYGIICISLDARSNGLIYIISSLLLFFKLANIRISNLKLFILICFNAGILYVAYIFYVDQVLFHGFGGSNAINQLSKASNPYNPFELIYYGRTDFFVLLQAVIDKPIFGHGSWAKDPNNYYSMLNARLSNSSTYNQIGFIPAHSVFLGSWAYAGIIGFFAILYMFIKLFKFYNEVINSYFRSNIYPILIVFFIDMIWAFLFSPIGLLRTTFPIFAAIIIVEHQKFINYYNLALAKQTKSIQNI